jgi:hypothetical protein
MYLCNFKKSEKSEPSLSCCSLITMVMMKQFETLQWHNKVRAIAEHSKYIDVDNRVITKL